MKSLVYRKELGIKGIFSESWGLFKKNLWLIFVISFVVYVPFNIILSIIPFDSIYAQDLLKNLRFYLRIVQLLEFLIGIVATLAIAYLIKMAIDKKRVGSWASLKEALFKWPAAVLTSFVAGISLLFLFLLLIVPGVIFSVYWMFALYAVILKDKLAFDALSYSRSVVKGRWWRVLGYSVVFGIVGVLTGVVIGGFEALILAFLPENFVVSCFDVVLATFGDFLMSFFTVVFVVFFINFDATKKK